MTTFELDAYVVDALLPDLVAHDRAPSAWLVFLVLWRRSHGAGETAVQLSLIDIATATGLSKRAVQSAISRLVKRKLIAVQRGSVTAVPVYTVRRPWVRERAPKVEM
ncbi:MAG: helix-turn-helix domain-containing protein [Gemmatimonadaceae bacterium]